MPDTQVVTSSLLWWRKPPVLVSYAVAVLSVAAALIVALLMQLHLEAAPVSLFLCAIMFSAWFGGSGPGLLAVALAHLAFIYYFVPPIHSLVVEIGQVPRILSFSCQPCLSGR